MENLYTLIARVPTVIWIIIGVCVVFPLARAAIRKGMKVLGILAIIAALLFIFPSIGSATMDSLHLTYDEETKTITNRDGKSVSINSFSELFKDSKELIGTSGLPEKVDDVIEKAKDATLRPDDLRKEIDSISEMQKQADYQRDENFTTEKEYVKITKDIIKAADDLGLNITSKTKIFKKGHDFYLELGEGYEQKLSSELADAIGLK